MYIFEKLSIEMKYLFYCMIFRLTIDSCYLWCDFYTDKSKTPFECLVKPRRTYKSDMSVCGFEF